MEIIAHRGASHDAPENTLAALQLAWAQGADAVECDVHLTHDGQLIVIHDSDTERTTGKKIVIAEAAAAALRGLDAGRWKNPKFDGEKIPTLDEWLALVPPGKRVFIEIKGGPETIDALERCIRGSALALEQVVIISFDFAAARAAKLRLPEVEACWILERDSPEGRLSLDALLARAREGHLDGLDLEVNWPIDEDFVQQMHGVGIKLYVWTLDDPTRARRLIAAGLDGITTNRPGWLRDQLAR